MKIEFSQNKKDIYEDISLYIKNDSIHPLALTNPLMRPMEAQALYTSISTHGQLEAIYVYRDRVIDGRNRLNALLSLGIKKIKVSHVKRTMSIQDIKLIVQMKETKRMMTTPQKAAKAYKQVVDSNGSVSLRSAAIANAVGITEVRAARDLYHLNQGRFDLLFKGKSIKLLNGKHSNSIRAVLTDTVELASKDLENATDEKQPIDRSPDWKQSVHDAWKSTTKSLASDDKINYLKSLLRAGVL